MHVRKTATKGSPDQIDAAKRVIETQVIPKAKDIPGFKGGYWLINRETGEGVSYTFYDSKESLQGSAGAATQIRGDAMRDIGAELTSVEEFEVAVDTGSKVHRGASHARVLAFQGDPGNVAEGIKGLQEFVVPAVKQIPGFVGGFWVVDRATGSGFGVTLYDSADNLAASREAASGLRSQAGTRLGVTAGEFQEFEVFAKAETPAGVGAH